MYLFSKTVRIWFSFIVLVVQKCTAYMGSYNFGETVWEEFKVEVFKLDEKSVLNDFLTERVTKK